MAQVNLGDLASLLQLAAGLSLASAVVIKRHLDYLKPQQEYLDFARTVVMPRVKNQMILERLELAAARFEGSILTTRFEPSSILNRLAVLNLLSGIISTVLLALPAFQVINVISVSTAFVVALGAYVPLALSLSYGQFIRSGFTKKLAASRETLSKEIQSGLSSAESTGVET